MVKGFRPGKEPPRLRQERARQQFGDLNATQERLLELFSERTPDQSRALIRRWLVGLLAGGIGLAVVAALLVLWSVTAAIVVGVVAMLVLVLWWRLRSQRDSLDTMIDVVSGRSGRRR